MEIEYLRDCYGLEDCFITGLPQFSFFNKRTLNHYNYLDAKEKNRIARYTNFCRNNFKHEPTEILNKYIININDILNNNQHHLIHGIYIYYFFNNNDNLFNNSISSISLKIGDVIFEYDICKLLFIHKKYFTVFNEFSEKNFGYIKLPVELFEDIHTWINLACGVPIELTINLIYPAKIRIDFLTITLDKDEERKLNFKYNNQPYDCITRFNDTIELNIKNKVIDNKLEFDLSHIKEGIKELSLFFKFDNKILGNDFINNITFRVKKDDDIIEINHDAFQLFYSNKVNLNNINSCIYDFPLSLFPENYHPSGDFFINNFKVSLIVSFNKLPDELFNCDIILVLVINKMKILRYYLDDDNNCKCKIIHLKEAYDKDLKEANNKDLKDKILLQI